MLKIFSMMLSTSTLTEILNFMPQRKDVKTIDANILLDFILQTSLSDRDKKNKVNSFFNPSNKGDTEIRIFVYTLGEVFKRLLTQRDENLLELGSDEIQRHLLKVQTWIKTKFVTCVKMDSLDSNFHRRYDEIDRNNFKIQKGDKVAIAAFCCDDTSKTFYTFDKNINQSIWLQEYAIKMEKRIQEP